MKPATKLSVIALTITGAIVVVIGALWLFYFNRIEVWSELRAELDALRDAGRIIDAGSTPEDWTSRVFIPKTALNSITKQFVDSEFRIPYGDRDANGKFSGHFIVNIKSLDIEAATSRLIPRLTVATTFQPEGEHPVWADARLEVELEAVFVPITVSADRGQRLEAPRVVPVKINPNLSWFGINVSGKELFERAIAAKVFVKFSDQLRLPIPKPEDIVVTTKLAKTEHQNFPGGGYTDIVADYPGTEIRRPFPLQVLLPTDQGLWLLGGGARPITPASAEQARTDPAQLQAEIARERSSTVPKFEPWHRPGDHVLVAISGEVLRQIILDALPPHAPRRIQVHTEKSDGDIARLGIMRMTFWAMSHS